MSAHSLTNWYRSHDSGGEEFRILRMSPSDTGTKEERALLLLFGLVRELVLMTVVQF